MSRLKDQLSAAHARTLGEFLWKRHGGADGKATPRTRTPEANSTRIRLQGEGAKALYEFYPSREMLEDESKSSWKSSAIITPICSHPKLSGTCTGYLLATAIEAGPGWPVHAGAFGASLAESVALR